jgi:hypothetical protein
MANIYYKYWVSANYSHRHPFLYSNRQYDKTENFFSNKKKKKEDMQQKFGIDMQ